MSPLKPTRSPNKRAGLPKQAEEARPVPAGGIGTLHELPTDVDSLAVILESAMRSAGAGDYSEIPNSKSQIPTPKAPSPNPQSQVLDSEPPILDTRAPIPVIELPRVEAVAPSARTAEPEAAAFDEVARSLAAAEACVPLLAQSTGLMRLAALDVVKAETARAGGLLQLLRFLRGDITPPMTAVSTAIVTQRVAQAAEAERRLRGIALTSRSAVADATCTGDETLLTNAILALLLITFALIENVQNARVTLSVTVNDEGDIGLAVSQDHVPPPAEWTRTELEELPADGNQVVPAIAITAAQRLAREWNGQFAMASGEHSSILTLWLPALQAGEPDTLPN